ncbi:zinc ABC transporter substrate-binding protein [Verrucomicrobiaceae bacterium N1E253]|uniref:Zinc ABC transporter substrate-binding protein n=1 Tax=Oceaniferula marina TaxID=2748318 RepID=A0A851GJP2_9BACT|nr:metal ABC transporter substrate-binding protein [Oceaniferula marina]NWK55385.1 zinc ABC transporter substrate-binding protein [Oceaniferula marina]
MQQRHHRLVTLFSFLCLATASAQTKVVALHPLMADLAKQVGGEHVEVVSLMRAGDDPHHFTPSPTMLNQARGASLYLASGMGLETYLDKLRDTLGNSATILEVGNTLPARTNSGDAHQHDHEHGEHCNHGPTDPHWWHRVSNMQRAADHLARTLSKLDPAHAQDFQANAKAYRKELAQLHSWIRRELIRIPKEKRKLATAHDSFGYFCDEYGMQSLAVQGINKSSAPTAKELAEIINTIRTKNIPAVFPEQRSNPKALKTLSKETGIRIGGTLIADGSESYTKMMRHNVNTITKALVE